MGGPDGGSGCATRAPFGPDGEGAPPGSDGKRDEWFDGCLPSDDPAWDPAAPRAPGDRPVVATEGVVGAPRARGVS